MPQVSRRLLISSAAVFGLAGAGRAQARALAQALAVYKSPTCAC